jgi:hypothetical protein
VLVLAGLGRMESFDSRKRYPREGSGFRRGSMNDQDEDELRTVVLAVSTATGLTILGVLTAVTLSMT